jgi:hypothetical protein
MEDTMKQTVRMISGLLVVALVKILGTPRTFADLRFNKPRKKTKTAG